MYTETVVTKKRSNRFSFFAVQNMTVVTLKAKLFYGMIKTVIDMSENKWIRFLQAAVLLILLLISAAVYAEHFMGCLLAGTALFVVFHLRSLTEEGSRSSFFVQLVLSLAFALCSGHFTAYLIFYELRGKNSEKRNLWHIVLPAIVLFGGTLCIMLFTGKQETGGTETVPMLLWEALLLTACAGGIYGIEGFLLRYARIRNEVAMSIKGAAINELNEKKLNRELRMKHYLVERNARLEERETISRNIHNSVGHTITAAIMTLDAAEMLFEADGEKAKERVITAKERMKDGLNAIRCAVRVLDKETEAVCIEDFLGELSAVADTFVMDTELEVKLDVDLPVGVPEIPRVHTEFLTGALQELLTNGVKHGNANRFLLSVTADSGHLQVSVKDNGTGDFTEETREAKIREGFGLKKIVSYVKKCGGSTRFTNENGFWAVITLPLYQEEKDGEL